MLAAEDAVLDHAALAGLAARAVRVHKAVALRAGSREVVVVVQALAGAVVAHEEAVAVAALAHHARGGHVADAALAVGATAALARDAVAAVAALERLHAAALEVGQALGALPGAVRLGGVRVVEHAPAAALKALGRLAVSKDLALPAQPRARARDLWVGRVEPCGSCELGGGGGGGKKF